MTIHFLLALVFISGITVLLFIELLLVRQVCPGLGGRQCYTGQSQCCMLKESYIEALLSKIEEFFWLNLVRHLESSSMISNSLSASVFSPVNRSYRIKWSFSSLRFPILWLRSLYSVNKSINLPLPISRMTCYFLLFIYNFFINCLAKAIATG